MFGRWKEAGELRPDLLTQTSQKEVSISRLSHLPVMKVWGSRLTTARLTAAMGTSEETTLMSLVYANWF